MLHTPSLEDNEFNHKLANCAIQHKENTNQVQVVYKAIGSDQQVEILGVESGESLEWYNFQAFQIPTG